MSPDDRLPRELPARPNLEQQRKPAVELLRAARAHDPTALRRIREHHPRFRGRSDVEIASAGPALHDAQLVLAREYGFPSWAMLKEEIERRRAARLTRVFVRDLPYHEDRVAGLASAREAGVPEALAEIRDWHPRFHASSDEEIRSAPFEVADAKLVHARAHGYATWRAFVEHVEALAGGREREHFLEAFEALRGRQWERLSSLLIEDPTLLRSRGTNGNTLLNLAVSLAGSTSEPLPPPALGILDRLLGPDVDVNQANGRGWTPLHQAAYSNRADLARRLVEVGASVDREAHGEGGTPLAVALFWGHREVADVLAGIDVVPRNLRVAAGTGRADLVREFFGPDGALTAAAGEGRRFYRPHSGFPLWRPSGDRQEILDEALVWAAKSDRVEVMPELVSRRADVNADPYRGTPLIWAASCNRVAAARWLLEHGAEVDRTATFGGPTHGEGVTALHLAAEGDHLEVARLLLEHGADPAIEDAPYRGTAAGWADPLGATRVLELLRT